MLYLITLNNLIPPGLRQADIAKKIIVDSLFHIQNENELMDLVSKSPSFQSKRANTTLEERLLKNSSRDKSALFNCKNSGGELADRSIRVCRDIEKLLFIKATDCNNRPFTYDTYPFRKALKSNWTVVLSSLSPENLLVFRHHIIQLPEGNAASANLADCAVQGDLTSVVLWNDTDTFDFHLFDLEKALSMLKEHYINQENGWEEILSSLSLIALTFAMWLNPEENKNEITHLAKFIFPPEITREIEIEKDSDLLAMQTLDDVGNEDDKIAAENLYAAKLFIQKGDFFSAGQKLEETVCKCLFVPDQILGQIFYLLGACCEHDYPIPDTFKTAEDIFVQAKLLGCEKASSHIDTILEIPKREIDNEEGVCIINTAEDPAVNLILKWLTQTMPETWKALYSSTPAAQLPLYHKAISNIRFALINDDYALNVLNALQIVDYIKKSIAHHHSSISDWNKTELYIRCEEEKVSPILDTALSFIAELSEDDDNPPGILRIFLIDDRKRAAQYLLARHCLHYPLTMPGNKKRIDNQQSTVLRFVIVSDNKDTGYVSWLIREAFWMLPITKENVTSRITVLSPDAVSTGIRINALCPGMEKFSTYNGEIPSDCEDIVIDDISFPLIEYIDTSFHTNALANEIRKLEKTKDALYYAIDSNSDTESVNLATRIREESIRCAVMSRKIKFYTGTKPVIAFRCFDPDYARLSQELLIPKENEYANNQWYNNYNLISWGTAKEIYSWSNLAGGTIESLSQCMHLQYMGIAPEAGMPEKEMAIYFNRLYNRDSSFAGAMSFPGRLYAAGIIPEGWFIQDSEAYWGTAQREYLADEFVKRYANDKSLQETLAKYEHSRWCLFMLSRGYLPGNTNGQTDYTIDYMKAGAPRHVLQIARLHPCICSWDQLKVLHNRLSYEYIHSQTFNGMSVRDNRFKRYANNNENLDYFTSFDYNSIEKTPDLIRFSWHPLSIEEPQKIETLER